MKPTKPPQRKYRAYAATIKGISGVQRIVNATRYSFDGLVAAYSEPAFRQLLILHGFLLIMAVVLPFHLTLTALLILVSFLSLIVELLNTAIEAAVDHTSMAKHELAKRAKDAGSAAQLVALLMIATLWIISLWSLLS